MAHFPIGKFTVFTGQPKVTRGWHIFPLRYLCRHREKCAARFSDYRFLLRFGKFSEYPIELTWAVAHKKQIRAKILCILKAKNTSSQKWNKKHTRIKSLMSSWMFWNGPISSSLKDAGCELIGWIVAGWSGSRWAMAVHDGSNKDAMITYQITKQRDIDFLSL